MLYRIYYIYTRLLLVAKDVDLRIPGPMSTGNRHRRRRQTNRSAGDLVRNSILLSIFTTERFFSLMKILWRNKCSYCTYIYNNNIIYFCVASASSVDICCSGAQWQIAKSIIFIYIYYYIIYVSSVGIATEAVVMGCGGSRPLYFIFFFNRKFLTATA